MNHKPSTFPDDGIDIAAELAKARDYRTALAMKRTPDMSVELVVKGLAGDITPAVATLRDRIKWDAAQRGDRLLAERVGGRLLPAGGHRGTDIARFVRSGRVVPDRFYAAGSREEATALEQDLKRRGENGAIIVIVEQSERDKAIEEYVRRRSASQAHIGRH